MSTYMPEWTSGEVSWIMVIVTVVVEEVERLLFTVMMEHEWWRR
jgi:hypothetical protein